MSIEVIPFEPAGKTSVTVPRLRLQPVVTVVLDALSLWLARRRQRDELGNRAEDAHLLKDIGITREQALREAGKPFWR
jgi:uncharacterized protein YjiS (DUF1127 family)